MISNNDYKPTERDIELSEHYAEKYDTYLRERMSESESYEHWENQIPHLIFKYRDVGDSLSLVRTIDIIQNHRLFMSPYWILNDPFEGDNVDYISSEDRAEFDSLVNECRILSLSRDCFSAPLWAHYASECRGICIGFITYHSFSCIQKLEYSNTIDKKQWWSTDKRDAINKEFLYKSNDWAYEDEYRIVRPQNAEGLIHESDSAGKAKAFISFEETELAVLIFGEHIDKKIKDALLKIIPSTCLIFDIKADKNRSRYYLVNCGSDAPRIYTLEELYKNVFNK